MPPTRDTAAGTPSDSAESSKPAPAPSVVCPGVKKATAQLASEVDVPRSASAAALGGVAPARSLGLAPFSPAAPGDASSEPPGSPESWVNVAKPSRGLDRPQEAEATAGTRPPSPLHADAEIMVPEILRNGVMMLKVSAKKVLKRMFALNAERGQVTWESKKGGVLNIETIREMRLGAEARDYRNLFQISAEHEPRWMSIVYLGKGKYKMLHVVALTDDVYAAWKEALFRILQLRRELLGGLSHMRKRQSVWLKQYWVEANTCGDSKLDFHEILKLCKRLNISAAITDIERHFKAADVEGCGYLDFTAFQRFVKLMKSRPEIEGLFHGLCFGRGELSEEEFCRFLADEQKSTLSASELSSTYRKFLDEQTGKMTSEGFATFLQSSENAVFCEADTRVAEGAMHKPLCDYFISSSHNTYLIGNQLKGESTVEGYIRALQQGCRSVELDVWNGDSSEPVVYHGRTLTSKLPVSDILRVIAKYAFVASPYPVVLSVEVHCDAEQQHKLAELLQTCLGSALVKERLNGDQGPIKQLPSPEDLKYRILLKAKNHFVTAEAHLVPQGVAKEAEAVSTTSESSSTSSDSEFKRMLSNASSVFSSRFKRISGVAVTSAVSTASDSKHRPASSASGSTSSVSHLAGGAGAAPGNIASAGAAPGAVQPSRSPPLVATSDGPLQRLGSKRESKGKPPKPPMSFELAALIVYTVGVKAKGFSKLIHYAPEHVLSLGERTAGKLIKHGQGLDLISHSRGHLTRSYPAGTRFTSSNYLPHVFWAMGVQLVACNWQTFDLGMEVNTALFNRNGRCGYVLKPELLRAKPRDKELAVQLRKFVLEVTIISGQQFPRLKEDARNVDPFVEVGVLAPGTAFDSAMKRRTKAIKGNGFNPVFDETFKIPFDAPGGMLDLCFIRFIVGDGQDDDIQLGRYCICAASLQPGYRHLPLYDDLGQQYLFTSLFIRTSIQAL